MFGGKFQLRARGKTGKIRVGTPDLIERHGTETRYLVGRSPRSYLYCDVPGVEESHCWILWDGLHAKVLPCPGAVVKVNGVPINDVRVLLPDDTLEIGEVVLRLVKIADGASSEAERHAGAVPSTVSGMDTMLLVQKPGDEWPSGIQRPPTRSVGARSKSADSTLERPSSTGGNKAINTARAADEALAKLFQKNLAEQKRKTPRPPPRP